MLAKAHFWTGAALASTVSTGLVVSGWLVTTHPLLILIQAATLGMIGGDFPDLDQERSIARRFPLKVSAWLLRKKPESANQLWFKLLNIATFGLAQVLRLPVLLSELLVELRPIKHPIFSEGHRTIFHSLWGWLISTLLVFSIGLCFANPLLGLFFAAGYLCHILLDLSTIAGIPLFYPVNQQLLAHFNPQYNLHSEREDYRIFYLWPTPRPKSSDALVNRWLVVVSQVVLGLLLFITLLLSR